MKIYRLAVYDHGDSSGAELSWHPSEAAAKAVLLELENSGCGPNPLDTITAYDVPADKDGMIGWLNIHYTLHC